MSPDENSNPELMREKLKFRLRGFRTAAGLTQRQAAEQLYWGLTKVIRIEQGAVSTTPTDAKALLEIYGITDPATVQEMQDLAKRTNKSAWTRFNKLYSTAAITLFGSEQSAKILRKYETELVPGLLQTEEYATALLTAFGFAEKNLEQRIEARLLRQQLLTDPDRPVLECVIGEAALIRKVGGDAVMRAQLERLQELSTQDNLSIQILPFAAGPHRRMGGGFTHLEFREDDNDLLYRENSDREESTQQAPELIAEYLEDFLELQEMACGPGETAAFIDEILTRLY